MADDAESDTCGLLKSWGVESEVINNFQENGIEKRHFKDLNNDLLKELCPKISTRIHLNNKIQEYITAESKTSTVYSEAGSYTETENACVSELQSDLEDNILLEMIDCRPSFPDFDLKTLLTTSPSGNNIITYYETHKQLADKHRNSLTDIICRRLFTRIVNHRINYQEYNILTSKIIALFPSENAGTYFVPPIKKRDSISGKPGFAKGKLVDKIRKTLFKSGERKRKPLLEIEKENNEHMKPKKIKNLKELQELHKDDVVWLKTNTEPWEDAIRKWKATYELRQVEYDTVGAFIENWPILNDMRSDVLIQLDFDFVHPGKTNKFYLLWNEFISKIKAIKKGNTKEAAALVEYIDGLSDDDHKLPSQVKLLCQLVPPKGRLNKRQKFSISECLESFIVDVQVPGDIQKKIDEISTEASGKRRTVQPYIIHCTNDQDNGGNFYLIIDKVRFVFQSAYKAFDTLFKCYHALHVSYPKSGYHLYLLIQKCVYDISTKYDVIPPYILDLISDAKC